MRAAHTRCCTPRTAPRVASGAACRFPGATPAQSSPSGSPSVRQMLRFPPSLRLASATPAAWASAVRRQSFARSPHLRVWQEHQPRLRPAAEPSPSITRFGAAPRIFCTAQSAGRCLLVVPVRSARSTKSTTSCSRARRRSWGLELEKAGMFQGGCAGRHPLAGRNPQRNPHRPEHKGKAEQQKVAAVHLAVKASRPRPEAPQSVALRLQKQSVLVRRRGVPEKRPQNLRTTRAALQLFSRLGGRRQAFRGGGDGLALLQSAPNTGRGRPPG